MAMPIIPRPDRGSLYSHVANVLLPTFAHGDAAWFDVKPHQLDLPDLPGGGR